MVILRNLKIISSNSGKLVIINSNHLQLCGNLVLFHQVGGNRW